MLINVHSNRSTVSQIVPRLIRVVLQEVGFAMSSYSIGVCHTTLEIIILKHSHKMKTSEMMPLSWPLKSLLLDWLRYNWTNILLYQYLFRHTEWLRVSVQYVCVCVHMHLHWLEITLKSVHVWKKQFKSFKITPAALKSKDKHSTLDLKSRSHTRTHLRSKINLTQTSDSLGKKRSSALGRAGCRKGNRFNSLIRFYAYKYWLIHTSPKHFILISLHYY